VEELPRPEEIVGSPRPKLGGPKRVPKVGFVDEYPAGRDGLPENFEERSIEEVDDDDPAPETGFPE
jgi:hypothetical protein